MKAIRLRPETMARLWSHLDASLKRSSAQADVVINRALDALDALDKKDRRP